jgi:exopolysaccharide biosynthesis polyprenyl glycosylphosphotransferase
LNARRSTRRRAWLERLSLAAVDVAAFALGLRVAHDVYLRVSTLRGASLQRPLPFSSLGPLVMTQIVTLAVVFFFMRLYHQPRGLSRVDLAARIIRAVSIGVILTYAFTSFLFPDLNYSRSIPVYDWGTTIMAVMCLRILHLEAWAMLRLMGFGRTRLLIVGAGAAGQDLIARMHRRPKLGYEIVGLVDDTPGRARARGVPVVGNTERLGELVERLAIDEVMLALPEASRQELLALISQCQQEGVSIRVFPDVFQMIAGEVQISALDGLPLLNVHDVALRGWRLSLKRAVDIMLSLIALVILSPLMLGLAILVKLESSGPAFFVQERMGLDTRPFPMIKFRSMRVDAESESGAIWATRADPRRTRSGRYLREWNLDELPQLVNILLGHMSIVGPRPERPEFVAEFQRHMPRYMERHREKGGLTGWAQVNGLRGNTSIEERTKYDLYYIENWSLLFDFKIMIKTLFSGFRDPNAY